MTHARNAPSKSVQGLMSNAMYRGCRFSANDSAILNRDYGLFGMQPSLKVEKRVALDPGLATFASL